MKCIISLELLLRNNYELNQETRKAKHQKKCLAKHSLINQLLLTSSIYNNENIESMPVNNQDPLYYF